MVSSAAELQELMGAPYPLSAEQWAAVSAPAGPAVVIAGAGSGKTTLMAARAVYLVATGQARPEQVLGLTFTTKAAAQLRQRIRQALTEAGLWDPAAPADAGGPTIATYNSYAAGLLTEYGLLIGHEPTTRVLADASRYQVAARVIDRHRGEIRAYSDHPPTVIKAILALDAELSEHLCDLDQVRAYDARLATQIEVAKSTSRAKAKLDGVLEVIVKRGELLNLVDEYRQFKAQYGAMDFTDQVALSARLALTQPSVGESERAKFAVVMLDEYQDTSVSQARLLRALFADGGHPVTAVGDPNQAIYAWRGAAVSNILRFGADFPDHRRPVPEFTLSINRRSDRVILQAANDLADGLYHKFPQLQPLRPAPENPELGTITAGLLETYPQELESVSAEVQAAHERGYAWSQLGVLARDNAHAADLYDELSKAGVPVEIVGLNGLLRLPEVSTVVATLELLDDLTNNPALLLLLTSPRWAIGPQDLALLGARARELSGEPLARQQLPQLAEQLAQAVRRVDPIESVALFDALADPGEAEYSAAARSRFAALTAELKYLAKFTGEPLLDLVRRIIEVTGIDLELASAVGESAQSRRDNLDLFVKAVADFAGVDGEVSLPALLAYLTAEDELGTGLDVATPTEANSVKLLTVHRAKGLEFAVVFLPGVSQGRFPVDRMRSHWLSSPQYLPGPLRGDALDLPTLGEVSAKGLEKFRDDARAQHQLEELRLGYVAVTRAEHELHVTGHIWRQSRDKPMALSPYLGSICQTLAQVGKQPWTWPELPADGASNPLHGKRVDVPWPTATDSPEVARRRRAAAEYYAAAGEPELDLVEQSIVAQWDQELASLLAELQDTTTQVAVPLPSSLAATRVSSLRDPNALARTLARPMPAAPSTAARLGTRFHALVELHFAQRSLFDFDDLPGQGDAEIADDAELDELLAKFVGSWFGQHQPLRLEAPFALVLGGQVIRGRIDAIYQLGDRFRVVDWKTTRQRAADPIQLAVYRLAWAELAGVDVDQVEAGFYYVRDDGYDVVPDLPGRSELEALFARVARA